MNGRRWVPAAACLAAVAAGLAADPPKDATPPGSVYEAVYFGAGGPTRIRFRVRIAGRPADAVWNEAVDALFKHCDRNGDGILNEAERAAVVPPRRGREAVAVGPGGVPTPLQLTFARKDTMVTRAVFDAALRAAGYGAVQFTFSEARPDSARLSEVLFKHLDADGDGKLSPDELKVARDRLAAFDANEDELLTAAELLRRPVQPNAVPAVQVAGMSRPELSTASSADLVFLTPDGGSAVKQVLAARGGARATALNRREFGGNAEAFSRHDKDGNGKLDSAELEAWLREAPAVDLELAFDAKPDLAAAAEASAVRTEADGAITATTAGTLFRFTPPRDSHPAAAWKAAADRLRTQLKQQAKGSGGVARKDVENQPALLPLFELADRNGDGRVDDAEVDAALAALAPLAACCVEIRFADQGSGLFELLDRNGDGQLSPRELVEALAVLRPFADAAGRVGPRDLKRRLFVTATVAGIPAVVVPAAGVEAIAGSVSRPAAAKDVPDWFTKMDRNGDGDVSLREFLGPIELFRKLDRDGDGLISPEEARAASAAKR